MDVVLYTLSRHHVDDTLLCVCAARGDECGEGGAGHDSCNAQSQGVHHSSGPHHYSITTPRKRPYYN